MLEEINFAHMVTITSDSENVFLSEMVPDEEVWIGLSQDFNGDWSWINGEYLEYQNWAEGQPDSSGSHAVLNWSQIGLWDDQDGYTQQKRFIVEFEGDGNWQLETFQTFLNDTSDTAHSVGVYTVPTSLADMESALLQNTFKAKENKYFANLINTSPSNPGEIIFGADISGVKGFFAVATFKATNSAGSTQTNELFAVSTEYKQSSY